MLARSPPIGSNAGALLRWPITVEDKKTALKQLPVTQTSSVAQPLTAQTSVNTTGDNTDVKCNTAGNNKRRQCNTAGNNTDRDVSATDQLVTAQTLK